VLDQAHADAPAADQRSDLPAAPHERHDMGGFWGPSA